MITTTTTTTWQTCIDNTTMELSSCKQTLLSVSVIMWLLSRDKLSKRFNPQVAYSSPQFPSHSLSLCYSSVMNLLKHELSVTWRWTHKSEPHANRKKKAATVPVLLTVCCTLLCALILDAAAMQNHSRDGICQAAAPLQFPERTADRLQLAGVFNNAECPAYVYLSRNASATAARLHACFHMNWHTSCFLDHCSQWILNVFRFITCVGIRGNRKKASCICFWTPKRYSRL